MKIILEASRLKKNNSINLIRIIAAFGVIMIHLKSSTEDARTLTSLFWPICVPFFLTASLTYFIKSIQNNLDTRGIILKLGERLAIPYLFWSLIYFVLLFVKNIITHQDKSFVWWRIIIYGESAVQLYFQTYLIYLQLLILSIFLFIKKGFNIYASVLFLIGSLYFIIGDIYNCFGVSASGQYIGLSLFILFSYILSNQLNNLSNNIALLIIGILILTIVYYSHLNTNFQLSVGDYSVLFPFGGMAVFLICLGYNLPTMPKFFENVVNNTYGIYLCHVLFLESFELVTEKILKIDFHYNCFNKILVAFFIFIISNLLTNMLRKFKPLRNFLLGER